MEKIVAEILENILSMLGLSGSFNIEEKEEAVFVSIELDDPGRLIGRGGETLTALQFLINQIILRQAPEPKRAIIDVANWRKGKEEDLAHRARMWAEQVKDSRKALELEPMPSWQRRIIHLTIEGTDGVSSESVGEGLDRHLVIKPEK